MRMDVYVVPSFGELFWLHTPLKPATFGADLYSLSLEVCCLLLKAGVKNTPLLIMEAV